MRRWWRSGGGGKGEGIRGRGLRGRRRSLPEGDNWRCVSGGVFRRSNGHLFYIIHPSLPSSPLLPRSSHADARPKEHLSSIIDG